MRLILFLAASLLGAQTVCINAGGPATPGCLADAFFTGGAPFTDAKMIALPTIRYGFNFGYSIAMPAGVYTVSLDFIEHGNTAAGQRVFSAAVNGYAGLEMDIYGLVGPYQPYTLKLLATSDGTININFKARIGNAFVNRIRIDPAVGAPPIAGNSSLCMAEFQQPAPFKLAGDCAGLAAWVPKLIWSPPGPVCVKVIWPDVAYLDKASCLAEVTAWAKGQ